MPLDELLMETGTIKNFYNVKESFVASCGLIKHNKENCFEILFVAMNILGTE